MAYRDATGSPASRGVSTFYFKGAVPQCDMDHECDEEVTHIGERGYVYCTGHAEDRRYWERCRKMRQHELNRIKRGEPLLHY